MSARLVTVCGLCGSRDLETVLSLGSSPPTCVMQRVGAPLATEEHHPLELLRCHDCTLVQLSVVVDPEVVFPPDYPYSSGNSRALHDNFEDLARRAGDLDPDDLVVDIGANDGTLLSKFDCRTVGVEPTGQGHKAVPSGRADFMHHEFFSEALARQILAIHGPAKVITACNVLAHVEDIGDVMRGIDILLADDGVLIAENHDLASVVDGQWDTVYHEHLRFYDPYSFNRLLELHGFGTREWQQIPTHGGSFRTIAHRGLQPLAPTPRDYDFEQLSRNAQDARALIRKWAISGGLVGIGATARATTIINYCGLDEGDLAYVAEVPGSDKIGHYIPGTRIPVVDEAALFEHPPRHALLLSWHLADRIIPSLRGRGYDGGPIHPAVVREMTA